MFHPWEDIFKLSAYAAASEFFEWVRVGKLSAYAAASEFFEWVRVGIDVYIPHRKYQFKPHSPP